MLTDIPSVKRQLLPTVCNKSPRLCIDRIMLHSSMDCGWSGWRRAVIPVLWFSC